MHVSEDVTEVMLNGRGAGGAGGAGGGVVGPFGGDESRLPVCRMNVLGARLISELCGLSLILC